MVRIENGRALAAVPIYMPADPAIPAKAIPATPTISRQFVRDKKILQREAVGGAWWLSTPAYLLLLAIATGWLIALGRGLRRLEQTAQRERRTQNDSENHYPRRSDRMTSLACTGHVLLDLPIFFGPVALLTGWVLYIARRDRRREQTTA